MEKIEKFIRSYVGLKGTTYKVRIRQRCPVTKLPVEASESFKTLKEAKIYKTIELAKILQGTAKTNTNGDISLSELISLYIEGAKDVGEEIARSKLGTLKLISQSGLGKKRIDSLTARDLVKHGQERRQEKKRTLKSGAIKTLPGAGVSTLNGEYSYLGVILKWAKSQGYAGNPNLTKEARDDLKTNKLVGKGRERNRRPLQSEIDALIHYFEVTQPKRDIPLGIIMRFAIGSGLRLGEICNLRWEDYRPDTKTIWVRDRKDPEQKVGKDDQIALIWQAGYDVHEILLAQRGIHSELIFPYSGGTISSVFPRAVKRLGIKDLHFHDLRHEFCSRMIEYGWSIAKVRVNSGHRNLSSMQRYINVRPESLHEEKPKA